MKSYPQLIAILIVTLFTSCDKSNEITENDAITENVELIENDELLVFSFQRAGGFIGLNENLSIYADSTHYSIIYREFGTWVRKSYQTTIKTSDEQWKYLTSVFDLDTFTKIENGSCRACLDGYDESFSFTKADKTYSIYNGNADAHFQQMQGFFDSIIKQIEDFEIIAGFGFRELNSFTVFFNPNDGSDIQSQNVTEGGKITKPVTPTRNGYIFVGWFKEVELVSEWNFNVDVVTSDITLYAKWIEWTGEEDPLYPITIYSLPEETLMKMRIDFAQRNPGVYTSLNQFGFCAMLSPGGGNGIPGGFTEEEAIAAVKDFVARNPEYTGVKNPDDIQFSTISSTTGYNDVVLWHFRTKNQIINDIEVAYTDMLFHTQNRNLVNCHGNHFPDVYIPDKFNFNIEQAQSLLLGKSITIWGWGGPFSAGTITTEHLQQSTAKLIIVPVTTDKKIELRVAWQIYLDTPFNYILEIDVMTGEFLREIPTVIA